uniref:Uncharacterized protein n=1 Tax=Plectus sambesii TaxID=2011161 RepID=A0A914WCY6_9BILA
MDGWSGWIAVRGEIAADKRPFRQSQTDRRRIDPPLFPSRRALRYGQEKNERLDVADRKTSHRRVTNQARIGRRRRRWGGKQTSASTDGHDDTHTTMRSRRCRRRDDRGRARRRFFNRLGIDRRCWLVVRGDAVHRLPIEPFFKTTAAASALQKNVSFFSAPRPVRIRHNRRVLQKAASTQRVHCANYKLLPFESRHTNCETRWSTDGPMWRRRHAINCKGTIDCRPTANEHHREPANGRQTVAPCESAGRKSVFLPFSTSNDGQFGALPNRCHQYTPGRA